MFQLTDSSGRNQRFNWVLSLVSWVLGTAWFSIWGGLNENFSHWPGDHDYLFSHPLGNVPPAHMVSHQWGIEAPLKLQVSRPV